MLGGVPIQYVIAAAIFYYTNYTLFAYIYGIFGGPTWLGVGMYIIVRRYRSQAMIRITHKLAWQAKVLFALAFALIIGDFAVVFEFNGDEFYGFPLVFGGLILIFIAGIKYNDRYSPSSVMADWSNISEKLKEIKDKQDRITPLLGDKDTLEKTFEGPVANGFLIKHKTGRFSSRKVVEIIYHEGSQSWKIECLDPEYQLLSDKIEAAFSTPEARYRASKESRSYTESDVDRLIQEEEKRQADPSSLDDPSDDSDEDD